MKLAQHIAHSARGLLELGRRAQAQLGHGIDDTALHRLQPIGDVGQGAIQYDVHGIIQVGLLRKFVQREAFVLFKIQGQIIGHGTVTIRQSGLMVSTSAVYYNQTDDLIFDSL